MKCKSICTATRHLFDYTPECFGQTFAGQFVEHSFWFRAILGFGKVPHYSRNHEHWRELLNNRLQNEDVALVNKVIKFSLPTTNLLLLCFISVTQYEIYIRYISNENFNLKLFLYSGPTVYYRHGIAKNNRYDMGNCSIATLCGRGRTRRSHSRRSFCYHSWLIHGACIDTQP